MDRITSFYPKLEIGGVIAWDLTEFDKAGKDELLNDHTILKPIKKNDNYVTFCKCDFNIKLLIYEKTTADDVITGWTKVNDEFKLGRLVNLFLKDSLYNLYLTKYLHEEPNTLLLLRLVYWYYKSSLLSESFTTKRNEIRKQLIKGLLNKREKLEEQIDTSENDAILVDVLASQLESIYLGFIRNPLDSKLKQESKIYRNAWFKAVWNFTSELLFAGCSYESGFKVTFQTLPRKEGHNYDFIVNEYPVQMKSVNTPYDIDSLADVKWSRKEAVDTDEITYDSVIEKIMGAVQNKIDEIDDALEKGARIVFLNGTSDESGRYFGQLALKDDSPYILKNSLMTSIQLAKEEDSFIPLIFCATGIRLKYYINTLPFRIPVTIINGRIKEIEVMHSQRSKLNDAILLVTRC
jgi:hypothetical protein